MSILTNIKNWFIEAPVPTPIVAPSIAPDIATATGKLSDATIATIKLFKLLEVEGALRIITAKPDPKGAMYPDTDSRHFVIHKVVAIDGPDQFGNLHAVSAEGDWCDGKPTALLRRLQEWAR